MSATDIVRAGNSLPRLASVRCVDGPHRLIRVTWAKGSRVGRDETIDLSPLVDTHKFYAPLRADKKLFASVHLINAGSAIAWGAEDEIDMAASSIQRLAEETMTADDYRRFLERNGLTHDAAAAHLGRSKRMLAYYLEQGILPRIVSLACYGLEARLFSTGESWPSVGPPKVLQCEVVFGYNWRAAVAAKVIEEKESHNES